MTKSTRSERSSKPAPFPSASRYSLRRLFWSGAGVFSLLLIFVLVTPKLSTSNPPEKKAPSLQNKVIPKKKSVPVLDMRLQRGQVFALGPFADTLKPLPFWLKIQPTMLTEQERQDHQKLVVVELAKNGAEQMIYPCLLVPQTVRSQTAWAVCVPFPLNPKTGGGWEAGRIRRFKIRLAKENDALPKTHLTITAHKKIITIANRFYALDLISPTQKLSGSADRLIRRIQFAGVTPALIPPQLRSDATLKGKIYRWQFTKEGHSSSLRTYRKQIAILTYYGGYGDGKKMLPLTSLRWRARLIFYANLPYIQIQFSRKYAPAVAGNFGRTFQLYVNPKQMAPLLPVVRTDGSASKKETYVAFAGKQGVCAYLLPSRRTRGIGYLAPDYTWGYLCASWENLDLALREKMTRDERVFYLFLSPRGDALKSLPAWSKSLRTASRTEVNWRIQVHNLLKLNNPSATKSEGTP